jgi:hypothetical protein
LRLAVPELAFVRFLVDNISALPEQRLADGGDLGWRQYFYLRESGVDEFGVRVGSIP